MRWLPLLLLFAAAPFLVSAYNLNLLGRFLALSLTAMGLVIPNAPALALSRHPDAAGTSAALLGAAQFGLGAAVSPLVGVLGNDELALAVVMTSGAGIALLALLLAGVSRGSDESSDLTAAVVDAA